MKVMRLEKLLKYLKQMNEINWKIKKRAEFIIPTVVFFTLTTRT